jgi:hypothetical protein
VTHSLMPTVSKMDELEALAATIKVQLKPKAILISDPVQVAALIAQGKYREHLPFWTRLGTSLILYPKGT